MAEATLGNVRDSLLELNQEQGKTTEAINSLIKRFQDMIDLERRAKLDEAEARREAANKSKSESARVNATDTPAAGDGFVAGFKEGLFDISGFGVLDILGIGALVTQIKGFFAATAKIVKDLAKVFSKGLLLALEGTFKGISAGLRVIENAAFKLRKIPGMSAIANLLARLTLFFEDLAVRVARISAKIMPTLRFVKGLGRVFGKLFLPLTIFITAWDTVKGAIEGFQDDGIIGGLKGAVDGFVNSLIGAPLDLIKDATAWLLSKMGFDETADIIRGFSFQRLFSDVINTLFNGVRGAVDFIKDIFSFPEDGGPLAIFQKFIDIVFLPVAMAINFVKGIFGFRDPEEPFSLGEFVTSTVGNVINFVKLVFSDPRQALENLWNGLVGEGGLLDLVFFPINAAVNFIKRVFDLGDPEEPFDFKQFVGDVVGGLFRKIQNTLDNFVNELILSSETALLRLVTLVNNIPDRILQFLSEKIRISIPRIEVPNPYGFIPGAPKSFVLNEAFEVGVPGGEVAASRIQRRNARLEAQILELQRRNAGGNLEAGGGNVITTINAPQSSSVNLSTPMTTPINPFDQQRNMEPAL